MNRPSTSKSFYFIYRVVADLGLLKLEEVLLLVSFGDTIFDMGKQCLRGYLKKVYLTDQVLMRLFQLLK